MPRLAPLPILLAPAAALAQAPAGESRLACPAGVECHVVCTTPAQPDYEIGAVDRAEFFTVQAPGGAQAAGLRVTLRGGSTVTFTGPELRCRMLNLRPAG